MSIRYAAIAMFVILSAVRASAAETLHTLRSELVIYLNVLPSGFAELAATTKAQTDSAGFE